MSVMPDEHAIAGCEPLRPQVQGAEWIDDRDDQIEGVPSLNVVRW